jgi:hypothetical protein
MKAVKSGEFIDIVQSFVHLVISGRTLRGIEAKSGVMIGGTTSTGARGGGDTTDVWNAETAAEGFSVKFKF